MKIVYSTRVKMYTYHDRPLRLLDAEYLRDIVDYSFGDDSGHHIFKGYTKPANGNNSEFISKYWQLMGTGKRYMTLFIDNIRLYRRPCIQYTAVEVMLPHVKEIKDQKVQRLANEDLLALLQTLPDMKFIIFTGFEDTPTDECIWDRLPENVVAIYGSHLQEYGRDRLYPIPYGLQRKLTIEDNRFDIIFSMLDTVVEPENMMYINWNDQNLADRPLLREHYKGQPWVTQDYPQGIHDSIYRQYLTNIKRHKFMLCPSGNAIGCECHRDWETIYMKRVPIVLDTPYHRRIFGDRDIPVLYVDSLFDITEQLLIDNDYLYQQMQSYDFHKLDYEHIYNQCIQNAELKLQYITDEQDRRLPEVSC